MKALAICCLLTLASATVCFGQDVFVNGYNRRDGTYVQPHMRTAPDSTVNNNFSTSPNVNPYTGQTGTRHPDTYSSPAPSYNSNGMNGPQRRSGW